MNQRQINILIGLGALGIAIYYGRRTSAQLAALAVRAGSPSPIVNPSVPPTAAPGTDASGRYPDDPGFDWADAGLG